MTLEEMNKQYLLHKELIKQDKAEKDLLSKELNDAIKEKEAAEDEIKLAEKAKDSKAKKAAEVKLQNSIKKIETIQIKLDRLEDNIKKSQDIINEFIEQLKSDPEIMKECEEAFQKNTERQIKKWEKRKEERMEAKREWEALKAYIEKNPQASLEVDKITIKTAEIRKIEDEIKGIDEEIKKLDPSDPKDAPDLARLNGEKLTKQTELDTRVSERDSSRSALKGMLKGKYSECIDQLEDRKDLDKNINNYERLINRADRKIDEFSMRYANTLNIPQQPIQTTPSSLPTPVKNSAFDKVKGFFKKIFKRDGAPTPATPATPATPTTPSRTSFSSSLKYEVVRDLVGVKDKKEQGRGYKEGQAMDDEFTK